MSFYMMEVKRERRDEEGRAGRKQEEKTRKNRWKQREKEEVAAMCLRDLSWKVDIFSVLSHCDF